MASTSASPTTSRFDAVSVSRVPCFVEINVFSQQLIGTFGSSEASSDRSVL
ncbi:hypothetical protein M6B38_117210 [Iris pallida]|uniref:Uncharacterized protein n=1 Tax=Iris pallida TaxID=29817 RepID=A0AAX6HS36_IRIPA|nr:hypothetical protein M6B38_117210 [Iris pallida]